MSDSVKVQFEVESWLADDEASTPYETRRDRRFTAFAVMLGMVVLAALMIATPKDPPPVVIAPFETAHFDAAPGMRTLIVTDRTHVPDFHAFTHAWAMRTGLPSLQGLFVEQAALGRAVADLMQELAPNALVWGVETDVNDIARVAALSHSRGGSDDPGGDESTILRQLEALGVEAILTDRRLPATIVEADGPVVYRAPAANPDARLYEVELQKREAERLEAEANKTDIGWGHQIRSYVLQPYQLVKDLRTGVESFTPSDVLDGDLDPFMSASLAAKIKGTDQIKVEDLE